MWHFDDILELIEQALRLENTVLETEQSVRGLDALKETGLHPLIAQAFTSSSHICLREVYFPSTQKNLPGGNQRDRCDFTLLPAGKKSLFDPVDAHKQLVQARNTLFQGIATEPEPADDQAAPHECLWIETKMISQTRYIDGVPVPNSSYSQDMITGPSEDVIKLAADPHIQHAAVLVVVFSAEATTGPHDLNLTVSKMIERDLPVRIPEMRTFPIRDIAGNAWCTLGLVPIKLC